MDRKSESQIDKDRDSEVQQEEEVNILLKVSL
jgi:hypothetical protein